MMKAPNRVSFQFSLGRGTPSRRHPSQQWLKGMDRLARRCKLNASSSLPFLPAVYGVLSLNDLEAPRASTIGRSAEPYGAIKIRFGHNARGAQYPT